MDELLIRRARLAKMVPLPTRSERTWTTTERCSEAKLVNLVSLIVLGEVRHAGPEPLSGSPTI